MSAEIDKQVAEKVHDYGWIDELHVQDKDGNWVVDGKPYSPTTNMNQAMQVIEGRFSYIAQSYDNQHQVTLTPITDRENYLDDIFDQVTETHESLPMAICLAALKAKGPTGPQAAHRAGPRSPTYKINQQGDKT